MQDPLSDAAVNVREWRQAYERARAIPERLAVELAQAESEAESFWEEARPRDDWRGFLPYLKRVYALTKEKAEVLFALPRPPGTPPTGSFTTPSWTGTSRECGPGSFFPSSPSSRRGSRAFWTGSWEVGRGPTPPSSTVPTPWRPKGASPWSSFRPAATTSGGAPGPHRPPL